MLKGRKAVFLLFLFLFWACLPPQTPTINPKLINSTRPIHLLVDYSVPFSEVLEAQQWVNDQVGEELFVIDYQRPTRNFIDDIVFVPFATTISIDNLPAELAGENIISANNNTHVFLGSEIFINKAILHDHVRFQSTLRHELLHDFFLYDIDCSVISSLDVMCGNGPLRLDAVMTREEIEFIRAE